MVQDDVNQTSILLAVDFKLEGCETPNDERNGTQTV